MDLQEWEIITNEGAYLKTNGDEANKVPTHEGEAILEAVHDKVSQAFFKETEFVEEGSPRQACHRQAQADSEMMMHETNIQQMKERNNFGFNMCRWSLNGTGAICSFGVAAASVCIVIFSNHK